MAIGISLTVLPDNEPEAIRVVETLSRAMAGLAFEGITVSLALSQYDHDNTEE